MNNSVYIFADETGNIGIVPNDFGKDLQLANARRIVACVNACEGISTADLEVAGRLAAAEGATLRRLADQRDELLNAIQSAINQVEYMHLKFQETGSGNSLVAQWKQLIAKAEGKR